MGAASASTKPVLKPRNGTGGIGMTDLITMPENYDNIRTGIVELLKAARSAAARNVNSIMTAAYWEIGRRIVQSRATRGSASRVRPAIGGNSLPKNLSKQFGRGFGNANLWKNARLLPYLAQAGKFSQTLSKENLAKSTNISDYKLNFFNRSGSGPPKVSTAVV